MSKRFVGGIIGCKYKIIVVGFDDTTYKYIITTVLEKNLNASRPSEHLPVRGREKMSNV